MAGTVGTFTVLGVADSGLEDSCLDDSGANAADLAGEIFTACSVTALPGFGGVSGLASFCVAGRLSASDFFASSFFTGFADLSVFVSCFIPGDADLAGDCAFSTAGLAFACCFFVAGSNGFSGAVSFSALDTSAATGGLTFLRGLAGAAGVISALAINT